MSTPGRRHIHTNSTAHEWVSDLSSQAAETIIGFHQKLPGFATTRLVPLPALAQDLGVKQVLVKDETSRLGLPAFKILGASWATYRAIIDKLQLPAASSLEELGAAAKTGGVKLFAATEGNHGRAVARMAAILGIESHIFVSERLDQPTRKRIADEGAKVIVSAGDYDNAVSTAAEHAKDYEGLLIQDSAFGDYKQVAQVRLINIVLEEDRS